MASKLLIRPIPFEGESFYSWLSRVCCENASRGKRRVLEMAGLLGTNKRIKPNPKLTKFNIADLSSLTGVDEASIHATLWLNIKRGNELSIFSRQFFYNQRSRICPICLAETGHWQKAWQLLPVTCCTKHSVRLTTSCKCGRPIEIYPLSILRCECGRNLYSQRLVHASVSEVELCRYVLEGYQNEVDKALVNRLYEIQFCLWFWYQSVRCHDEKLIRSWSNRRIVSGVKYVGSLIKCDSIDLQAMMRRFLNSTNSNESRFRTALGGCHDYVKRMVAGGYSGSLGKRLNDFEEYGWKGSTLLRRARYGQASKLITKTELAELCQCNMSKLERVIKFADKDPAVGCDQFELVDVSDVKRIKERVDSWLSPDEAVRHLNISRNWVLQLVQARLLEGRKRRDQRDWLISTGSCHNLLAELKERQVLEARDYVPLKLLQLFPEHDFSLVVSRCLERKVSYRIKKDDDPLGSICVDRDYIKRLKWKERSGLLSAMEAAEYFNINLNAFYYLVNKGYIGTSLRYCRNRKVYGFSNEDIDAFRETYCFYFSARDYLISSGRPDLLPALKAVNSSCKHRSRIRIYKWHYVRALLNRPKLLSKPSLLYGMSAAAQFAGVTINKLRSLTRSEWILPYKPPGHHNKLSSLIQFTETDLNRLKVLLENYPELMPLRAASKILGYDRSHVRKQFVRSGYLHSTCVPECPGEILCFKKEVFALKRLITKTVTGPQLALLLGVTRNTVYKWMRAGKLIPIISPSDEGFGNYRYSIPNKGG